MTSVKIKLVQKRLLLENNGNSKPGNWIIPLSVRAGNRTFTKLMKGSVIIPKTHDWFKVNEGQRGFYRVKYDQDNLDVLGTLVEEKSISNVDRWSIHHDLYALCLANQIPFRQYLDFVKHYEQEDDYVVLSDIVSSLNFFHGLISDEKFCGEIKEYNQYFFKKIFERLGWDPVKGEKSTYALLRNTVIGSLGRLDDEEILDEANSRFSSFLKSGSLNPDLRSAIYSVIAWNGDVGTYRQLLGMYRKAQTQEEKVRFLGSLSNFQDKKLLTKTLNFSLSKEVRTQNLFVPISKMVANPHGKDLVWPWIKKNWCVIVSRFGVGNPLLNKIIGSISVASDKQKEREIRQFFARHHVPGTEMKLAQTLERIRINAKFLDNVRREFN